MKVKIRFRLFIACIICTLYKHRSHGLSLSPIERILFQSRISSIQSSIEEKFPSLLVSSSSSSFDENKNKNIILIFPGAGGIDELVTDVLESIEERSEDDTFVSIVNWKEYTGSMISAAFDSEAVGECVANCISSRIAKDGRLDTVHSIGVSVGSFAANAFAQAMKKQDRIYTRLTLLDPFCTRGLWGIGYGDKHFGHKDSIDYAEQYLNTDDPVPSTNDPLSCCAVIDVTKAKERDDFVLLEGDTMHSWPVAYYSRHVLKNSPPDFATRRLYHGENGMPRRGSIK